MDNLRKKAEEKVEMLMKKNLAQHLVDTQGKELLHELQVHMVELTMQNEELRDTQMALEEAKGHYQALYDSSPVCYFSLDGGGVIYGANLTAADFLNVPREQLIGRQIQSLLTQESADSFHLFLKTLPTPGQADVMELQFLPNGGSALKVPVLVNSLHDRSRRRVIYQLLFIHPSWLESKKS
jgi:PAS domain S-box-containing protein